MIYNKKLRVLITGASRGIGRAIAVQYAKKGAELLLLARDEKKLSETLDIVISAGGNGFFKYCDVAQVKDMDSAVEFAVESMGGLDIAILNAGIGGSGFIDGMELKEFKHVFEVNLFGIINGLSVLVPLMKKQGYGTIVGISSLADSRGLSGSASYNSSKIAVSHLLESARMEMKDSGIRIVTVKPGFIRTDMTAKHKFYMPFLMDVDKAAKRIIRGIDNGKKVISFPKLMVFASFLAKISPASLIEYIIGSRKSKTE